MTSGSSEKKINFSFPFPSYDEWQEVARQELEGADPTEKLSIQKGNLEILPFYSAPQKETESSFMLKPSSNPHHGARSWVNTPKILVSDEKKANDIALSYLNSGAEGILFDCQSENINPAILLDKISLADCSISFLANERSKEWLKNFATYTTSNFDKNTVRGCIFWRKMSREYADIIHSFEQWPQFYSLGILVQPKEDITDEIAETFHKVVDLMDTLTGEKINPQLILDQISFSVSVSADFFLEMARIKSLRNLWCQFKGAYDIKSIKPLHIHANSMVLMKDAFQPHGNMIKSTTSAMASVAGGCDSLTVEPEDPASETMSRIARNVSSILRDESHFSKVADPTAGSYYIDSLTDQVSEKAWRKFQSLVK
jgi:methylmalonyl-CoA mutase